MRADFDNELRLQEHEFNLRMDEMRAVVLSHNLRVRRVKELCFTVYRMCFTEVMSPFMLSLIPGLLHNVDRDTESTLNTVCKLHSYNTVVF